MKTLKRAFILSLFVPLLVSLAAPLCYCADAADDGDYVSPEGRVYRSTNLWPILILSKSREEERKSFLTFYDYAPLPFQLYSRHSSAVEGSSGLHLLGSYHRLTDEGERTTLLFTLPSVLCMRYLLRTAAPLSPFYLPLYYQKKEALYTTTIAGFGLPFYWAVDDELQKVKWSASPLFFSKTTLRGKLVMAGPLLPLYIRSENAESARESTTVLPLYYSVKTPEYRHEYLVPLYMHNSTKDSETKIWLLYYWYFRSPYSELTFCFPYYRRKEEDKDVLGVFPVFSKGSSSDGKYYSWSAPFLLSWGHRNIKEKTFSLNLLAPVGLMRNETPDSLFTGFLLPVGYAHYKTADRETSMYTPLCWSFRDPGGSLSFLGPLYRKKDEKKTTVGLFPLLWDSRGKEYSSAGFFPFAWGHRDSAEKTSSLYVLPPLLYMYSESPSSFFRSFLLPLGYMRSETPGNALVMRTPLWWYSRSYYGTTDLVIPFFYRNRTEELTTTSVFPPFLWWGRARDYRSFVFFPFVWHFADYAERTDSLAVLPLYYHHFSPKNAFETFFPVYWYWRDQQHIFRNFLFFCYQDINPERTREGVFPVLRIMRSRDYNSSIFFPFYWYRKDFNENSLSWTLIPFYFHNRIPDEELNIAFPFFIPLYVGYSTADYRFWAVPFYWHFKSAEGDRKFGILPPVFWYGKGGGYSFSAFIPFYYYFNNFRENEKTFLITPALYYHKKTADWELKTAALYYWYYRDPFHKLLVLPPYYRAEYPGRLVQGIFPAARWVISKNYYRFYGIPFVLWGERDKEWDTHRFAFLPFYYLDRSGRDKFEMRTPLWWHNSDAVHSAHISPLPLLARYPFIFYQETQKSDLYGRLVTWDMIPLLWFSQGSGYYSAMVFPVFKAYRDEKKDEAGSFLLPLWLHSRWGGTSFSMITPLFWRYSGTDEGNSLSLLLAPLYDGERITGVVPAYHKESRYSETYGIFPFWWLTYRDSYYSYFLPPVWGYSDKKEQSSSFMFFPVFYSHTSPEEKNLFVLLFFMHKEPGKSSIYSPLYCEASDSEKVSRWIFPTYFSTERETGSSWIFLPLAWGRSSEAKGTKSWNVLPFFYYSRSPEVKVKAYLPLYWHSSTPGYSLSVLGPLYRWKSEDGYRREGLFPLYWTTKQDEYRSRGFLPLYWMSEDKPEGRFSSVFIPFYYHTENRLFARRFDFFPLPLPIGSIPYVTFAPIKFAAGVSMPVLPIGKISWQNKERGITNRLYFFGLVPVLVQDKHIGSELREYSILWYLYRKVENYQKGTVAVEFAWAYRNERRGGETLYKEIGPRGLFYIYDKLNGEEVYFLVFRKKLKED
jgi:hypothetical protein